MKIREKRQNTNIFKLLSILLIIIFIFSIPMIIQKLIKITKIECVSQYGNCEVLGDRLQVTGNYKNTKKQIEQILKQNIQVNSYLIQYKIPDTLKIEISLKKPKYAIFYGQKYYLLDKNGLILSEAIETNLPSLVVNNYQNIIGNNISDKELFSLKIIEKVAWLYSVKVGFLENNELLITLKEGVLVHFPLEGDIDILVGSLRLVFSRLNDGSQGIRISDIREIDLRYKNIVLR